MNMHPPHRPAAIVTGASSGIGRECARILHTAMDVALVARRPEKLEDLATELGDGATAHPADLTQVDEVRAAIDGIVALHPTVDVLVNCAGSRPPRLLTSMVFDEAAKLWEEQLRINLTPSFTVSFLVAPHLRRPGGRIVNIGSIAANTGGRRPGSTGYAAAKAAVHGLTLGLSRELAPEGICVNTVVPGFVAGTEFTGAWGPEVTEPLVVDTPAGRAGTPTDVAAVVAFMASPAAGFVTGQVIHVNGGLITSS